MNRVIKFRAKPVGQKEFGEWIYGDLHTFDNSICVHKSTELVGTGNYNVIPETIGQFTGLHDKNGKEIYEGDIVLYVEKYRYIVRFGIWNHNPQNCATAEIISWHLEWADMLGEFENLYVINGVAARFPEHCGKYVEAIDNLKLKVIGNIHDNPELLKTEQT